MNDEIKGILEYLKKSTNSKDFCGMMITKNNLDKILDYITNLQKENERLNNYYNVLVKICDKRLNRYLDYRDRIDKAIEFIKENSGYDEEISSCCDDLLYSDCDNLIALLGGDE